MGRETHRPAPKASHPPAPAPAAPTPSNRAEKGVMPYFGGRPAPLYKKK